MRFFRNGKPLLQVTLDLAGDFHEDIRETKIRLRNPDPSDRSQRGQKTYMEGFAQLQLGPTRRKKGGSTNVDAAVTNDVLTRRGMPRVSDEHEALLTAQEVAELLNVPVSWVYEHTRERGAARLPHLKLGKYLRFEERAVREFLNRQRRP
jgi:excisionase family DNA binding protein